MDMGSRIQGLRKQQGLSQEALADRLGVTRQAIGKWESGGSAPSIDNLLELASILNTSVDYLLTGREPEFREPLACSEAAETPPETVSLEALKALLADRNTQRPKMRRYLPWLAAAGCMLVLVILLCYYISRVNDLEQSVSQLSGSFSTLNAQVQNSIGNIQLNIEESLNQQASILSDSSVGLGEYDPETNTAAVRLSAMPKTLTEDTEIYFVLSPMASTADTLENAFTVPAQIPDVEGPNPGIFTAEVQVPMVDTFVVSVLLKQDGIQQTETIYEQYGFSQHYICTMEIDWGDFCYGYSETPTGTELTVSGTPSCTINPPPTETGLKPKTLLCQLFVDGQELEAERVEFDVYEDIYGGVDEAAGEQAVGVYEITYYPGSSMERTYPCGTSPEAEWVFTLTDTAGNKTEKRLSKG